MRAQFDEIIGTPPPSTIDSHLIERRVRRTRTARRIGVAATALTVAVAGLTGALLVGDDPPVDAPPPVAKDTATPTSTAPPPPDNRFQLRSDTRTDGDASAKQLAALLEKATKDVAAGAVWVGPLDVKFIDGTKQWTGSGKLEAGGRAGTIFVMTVGGVAAPTRDPALTCPPDMTGCVQGTSPGGRDMMTFDGGKTEDGSRLVRAAVELPGHRVIIIHHTPEASGSVLSAEQFLRIVDAVAAQLR